MSVCNEEKFLADVASHKMTILSADGINRHVRFSKPGTMCMHFDLITWPGYLCYTGDMGTYVFRRLHDMFDFFRADRKYALERGKKLGINLSYWSEKLEAIDRCDGVKEFSPEKFRANVMRWIEAHGWTGKLGHGLREELDAEVLSAADDGESAAYAAVRDFRFGPHEVFADFWEVDSREYTRRFVWCCYALAWGIGQFDALTAEVAQ